MRSLLRHEAETRADQLTVTGYDVTLDLRGDRTFPSRTVIDLVSRGGSTFLDLKPVSLESISLDGAALPVDALAEGRYPLDLSPGDHRIEVVATMPFRQDGEGLHRSVDPADGRAYLYQMSFMSAAPTVFACFDQPDLKAPYTLHVTAPEDWSVTGNAPGRSVGGGQWEFETTEPLSTYFVTIVGGPYHRISDSHDGIPLGLLCRTSMASALDADADEIFTMTKQCFDEYHRLFGVRYAFGKYDQAWVPEFNAGAMENPGCVTFREGLLFTTQVPRALRIQRATTVAHEMAHQWFGNLVTPRWWDDLWLNEAFAEYMGNRVTAAVTEFSEALVWASLTRKNWGMTADARPSTHPIAGNGAVDADAALQDFDGISYAKGHAVLTQLAHRVGDDVFLGGVREHFAKHRFGNATMHDLFAAWERAGAADLQTWSADWLRTSGVDRIELTRDAAVATLVRTAPDGGAGREHDLTLAVHDGTWTRLPLTVDRETTPVDVPVAAAVILDATNTAWADLAFDEVTLAQLPGLIPSVQDPVLRATLWNTTRNAVHHVRLDPDRAVDLLCAGIPDEPHDTALAVLGVWAGDDGEGRRVTSLEKLLPVTRDAGTARRRLHAAFTERAATAEPGSELQFTAVSAAIGVADDVPALRALVDGEVPDGITLDPGLRWRALKRLASLDAIDAAELDVRLAEKDDAKTRVDHAWARARLPYAEAKEWAWQRFTGEVAASNYEIEAVGQGFWQTGRDDLLAPYAERYFRDLPGTTAHRAGWLLADAGTYFFPITLMSQDVVDGVDRLLADGALNPTLRRVLLDAGDELRCRLRSRARYGAAPGAS